MVYDCTREQHGVPSRFRWLTVRDGAALVQIGPVQSGQRPGTAAPCYGCSLTVLPAGAMPTVIRDAAAVAALSAARVERPVRPG